MGLNLLGLGKKIEDIIGQGLGNVGNAAEGLVGIHPTFNQPQQQQPQAPQGPANNPVGAINQATGFQGAQFNPFMPPPLPPPMVVKKINKTIGGSPIQQAQNAPQGPTNYTNPLDLGTGFAKGLGTSAADFLSQAEQTSPIGNGPMGLLIKPALDQANQAIQAKLAPKPGLESTGYIGGSAVPYLLPAPGAAEKAAVDVAPTVTDASKAIRTALSPAQTPINDLKVGTDALGPVDKQAVAQHLTDIQAGKPIEPVVTRTVDGQQYIQDGKHRVLAAQQAGLTHVPTIDQSQFLAAQRGSVPLGPMTDNPRAVTEIKQGNATALAKSLEPDTSVKKAIGRSLSIKNNPVKMKIAPVNPGDYGHAIANSQQVSKPLDVASGLFQNAIKKLSPDEKANFWKSVETPSEAHSPNLKAAVVAWRQGADMASAGSHALGGTEGYIQNYARHPWDLSGWQEAEQQGTIPAGEFQGINRAPRTHDTIAQGEAAGLKLGTDPLNEGTAYFKAAGSQLRKEALAQGLGQADAHIPVKPHTLDLGYGKTVPLSEEGMQAVRGLHPNVPTKNLAVKGLRTVNSGAKSAILSLGQFHTINIGALRAAPALILRGHPVAAGKGLYRMFRGAFGSQYADRVIGQALKDGTVEKAAKIGMPYGGGGYSTEGTFLKHGIGSRTVFGKQIPMMHDQVVRSIISDLEKRNIPLDSPEARQTGLAGAHIMGEMNHELENISPKLQRAMSDWMLAGQFTPSKFKLVGTAASKGGLSGNYARTAVLANVAAVTAVAAGIGALNGQESDNIKDILLRALVDPAAPTPGQDSKGNTQKLRLPGTDTSDIAKLIGITLVRGQDGHLGVNWKPSNMPTTVEDFLRARLSPLASAGVKLATNTTFAGKPLYDPNASAGTKAEQAAASIITGGLPIGLQGLAYTDAVKNALPQGVKDVLDAQTPGSNPVVKSLGSSFGLTPSTDTTTGKGQQTSQYFSGLNDAKKGLNQREQDALDIVTGGKKNPVTGKYEIDPTVYDTPTKANALLQNPKVLQNLTAMNQKLAAQGQNIDPFYKLSPDQQVKALQIDRLDPQNPDKTQLIKQDGSWYQNYQKDRQDFFSSLPAGDPNKPKAPVQYVAPSASTQSLMDKYNSLTDPAEKSNFLKNNQAVQDAFDATAQYDKELRAARGLPELKGYPSASPGLQAKLDQYNTLDKASRSAFIKANPDISSYFQKVSQYTLENDATQARYVGNDFTPKGVKAIQSLGNDIYYNGGIQGSNGQIIAPTGSTPGATGASKAKASRASSSSSKSDRYALRKSLAKSGKVRLQYGRSKFPNKPFNYGVGPVSVSKPRRLASKGVSRPKVSLKSNIG